MEPLKPQFPIDFTENGDTTSQAIEKHIKELSAMYEKMTEIYGEIEKANEETRDIWTKINAYGTIVSKNTGAAKGEVPTYGDAKMIDANVTGTAANMTGILAQANGGTGTTSIQSVRNLMGLGNTLGVLPIGNGGTAAADAGNALRNLGGMLKLNANNLVAFNGSNGRGVFTPNIAGTWVTLLFLERYSGYNSEGSTTYEFLGISTSVRITQGNTHIITPSDTERYKGFFWKID